jgi:hypothetical protein
MSNFARANEDDAYMYAKLEASYMYRFFQLNTSRFALLPFSTMQ